MQTPTGSTGQHVQMVDWNMWASALADLASWWADAFGQQNVVVPGGGALSAQAGTPIVVNYSAFTAYINGPARMARFTPGSGSVTLAAADTTYARYDLIVATASQTTPNDSAGNATALDVLTVTKVTGTPANPPLLPSLPAYSVQLGTVLVPANATSASTCTITQAVGPLTPNNLQDLTNHIAASLATAVVHGFRATAPGGPGANQLAQLDANSRVYDSNRLGGQSLGGGPNNVPTLNANSAVDAAQNVVDTGGNHRAVAQAGQQVAYQVAQMDGNGRVGGANNVQGYVPGTGSGNLAILDGNGAVAKAEGLVAAGVVHKFTSGKTGTFSLTNQQDTAWSVTLDDSSFTPTVVVASVIGISSPTNFQDFVVVRSWGAGTASGVVYQVGGGPDSVQVHVFAYA